MIDELVMEWLRAIQKGQPVLCMNDKTEKLLDFNIEIKQVEEMGGAFTKVLGLSIDGEPILLAMQSRYAHSGWEFAQVMPMPEPEGGTLEELTELSKPLMKWLADHQHPHAKLLITFTGVELLEVLKSSGELSEYAG